jgi:hypothetical protein
MTAVVVMKSVEKVPFNGRHDAIIQDDGSFLDTPYRNVVKPSERKWACASEMSFMIR